MTKAAIAKRFTMSTWPDGSKRSQVLFTPGIWRDITPPISDIASTFGTDFVAVSKAVPGTIIAACDMRGAWKSTAYGTNWTRMGTPGSYDFSGHTTYLDSPVCIAIDPFNGNHLYATQGVRGDTLGFWVSTDGGVNWDSPAAFRSLASATTTNDVTSMAVNPADFNHVLIGSHSPWQGGVKAGIMETLDGGVTWTTHAAPATWPSGSLGIIFLYDPASGQGNSSTWLAMTDGDGCWRTTNSGSSWTKVSTNSIVHHGCRHYYAADTKVWIGGQPYPMYSTDNGVTWTQATAGLESAGYYQVWGDGTTLYTQVANTGDNGGGGSGGSAKTYMVTSETSPGTWTAYNAQTFFDGPFNMDRDTVNDIIYSANWRTGVWALKVLR